MEKTREKSDSNLGLFEALEMEQIESKYSSKEIKEAVEILRKAERSAEKREAEERCRKEQEEAQRKSQEEKEQKELHIREGSSMDLPLDWDRVCLLDERAQDVHTENIPDALILSLTALGKVDIAYISSITGEDYKTVISTLKGSIYQNPQTWGECFYKGWETAEEYLSGNLRRKWKIAKEADEKYQGYFSDNVKAIEKVLPPTVAAKDIYITLGSPWVPADVIDDFILYLFGDPLPYDVYYGDRDKTLEEYRTIHDEITGTWEIPCKSRAAPHNC